jgi:hypothetical protein
MPIFEDLQPETYYLIREEAGAELKMVSVLMHTEKAVLIRSYLSTAEDFFKNKEDALEEILEELDDNMVLTFESLYLEEDIENND